MKQKNYVMQLTKKLKSNEFEPRGSSQAVIKTQNDKSMFKIQIEPEFHLELMHLVHSEELFALVNLNREYLRKWLPWVDDSKTLDDSKCFIKRTMRQFANDLGFQVGIFFQDNLIGVSGYLPINKVDRCGEIGYWLSENFEGRGFMTKACTKLIELGFISLNLNKITVRCAVENQKSRGVIKRLGFKKEGVLRQNEWLYDRFVDHEVYSLLKSEYSI